MSVLIAGVRLYGEGEPTDLLLADGEIVQMGERLSAPDAELLDGTGLIALPGFVDLHTHGGHGAHSSPPTIPPSSAELRRAPPSIALPPDAGHNEPAGQPSPERAVTTAPPTGGGAETSG